MGYRQVTAATTTIARQQQRTLEGNKVITALKESGIRYVLSVPDIHTSEGLLKPIAADPYFKLIRVCKEDECLGIAAGLTYGNHRALILIQYTGFLYAMNAVRAVAVEHQMPMCFMIGLLGKEPDKRPQDSKRVGVRVIEPLLDLFGIERHLIETDDDVGVIAPRIKDAYETSHPVAFLMGRRPAR